MRTGRVELYELEVLQRQPRASDHGVAIAGARVRRRGAEVRPPVAAGRQDRLRGPEPALVGRMYLIQSLNRHNTWAYHRRKLSSGIA